MPHTFPPDVFIDYATEYHLSKLELELHESKGGTMRPSEIGKCPRKLALTFEGVRSTDQPDQEFISILDEGLLHEKDILARLKRRGHHITFMGDWVRAQIGEVRLYGRLDGVAIDPQGRWVILEIKTIDQPVQTLQEPYAHHVLQAQFYLHHYVREIKVKNEPSRIRRADAVQILYKNRSKGTARSFTLLPDEGALHDIETRVETAMQGSELLLPEMQRECSGCRYKTHCWGQDAPQYHISEVYR